MVSLSTAFFSLLILTLTASASNSHSNSSFSFTNFTKNPTFNSSFTLYKEAKLANASVELTGYGRVMYNKPIKIYEGKPKKSVSFSTRFSFSMSKLDEGSLVFLVVPTSLNLSLFGQNNNSSKLKVVGVQLKYDYLVGKIHVGFDVGSLISTRVNNASGIRLNVSNGDRAKAWIDYEAGSKRIEVRLSHLGGSKPAEALVWCAIDLSKLWGDEKVFIGLAALNRNSWQSFSIYSWSFEQRHVPDWMHSQPLDPDTKTIKKPVAVEKRKDCVLRAVAAMVLGVACGALASYIVLCLWRIFGNRRPVVPEEFAMQAKVFEYEKMKVEKSVEDGKQ